MGMRNDELGMVCVGGCSQFAPARACGAGCGLSLHSKSNESYTGPGKEAQSEMELSHIPASGMQARVAVWGVLCFGLTPGAELR